MFNSPCVYRNHRDSRTGALVGNESSTKTLRTLELADY
jgi:hypothetical protein